MDFSLETSYNATNKVWSGPVIPRDYGAEPSLGKALLATLLQNPEHVAQICYPSDKAYTNKALAALSISVAHHFTKLGLKQCDIISVCAGNTDFLAPLFFGAMFKGLTVSTLGVDYHINELKHHLSIAKPKLVFCDVGVFKKLHQAAEELRLNCQIYTMKEHVDGKPSIKEFLEYTTETLEYIFEPLKTGLTQTAAILCSSGTTGLPKGLAFSHEDLLEFSTANLLTNEIALSFNRINWFTGLSAILTTTFSVQTRILSEKPFSPADFCDIVAKYRVSLVFTPPPQMAMLLASSEIKTADLSSLKLYFCGSSAVSYSVVKELEAFIPNAIFLTGYGMSEARSGLAVGMVSEVNGFVGVLLPNVELKVIDDGGQKLGPNAVGEIYFNTPRKWLGYFGNEKATKAAYDDDGWLATGDLGYFDEQGQLYLVERKKDILNFNGFKYSPTEIEQVIQELNDVVNVCAFGLLDVFGNDLPTVAIVKKVGSNIRQQDVYDYAAKNMPDFKHLRGGVYFLDEMPLTDTGKILRREVKKICEKLRNGDQQQKSKL